MKTWVLVLLGCMLAATSHAQTRRDVYEWTDADGVKHYSDQPQPGARKITLNSAPPMGTVVPSASPSATTTSKPAAAQAEYAALEIISPQNESSFFEPDDEIVVRVRSEPTIDEGDRLVTYLDSKPLGDVNQTEHRLAGLERGAHTLQSAIYGFDGKEKIRSAKITFHMKQPTAGNPRNVGPALKPPPSKPPPR
ncbi:MAG: DUF4124 domain-containing protein [Gammaproteobacteria bacterium]|nr:DUF4124 domain-containing protein [Gammaproteobacteria bacterium]